MGEQKMAFRFFLLGLATFALAACSGGAGSGEDASAQQQRDSKVLTDLYAAVEGTWSGTVSNPSSGLADFEADLKLYVFTVQDGVNPDGKPKIRPTLRGRFRPKKFVADTDFTTLVGDYDRNGRLTMTALPSSTLATPFAFSVAGTVARGNLDIEVVREGGVWGRFTGIQTSTIAESPTAGEMKEYRERFRRINGVLEGRYIGRMKSVDGNDYNVEFAVSISPDIGATLPTLVAQYRRLDMPPGTVEWSLIVDYNGQVGDVQMRNDPAAGGGGTGVAGGRTLSANGTLLTIGGDKVINVTVRDRAGIVGTVEATLQSGSGGGRLPFQ